MKNINEKSTEAFSGLKIIMEKVENNIIAAKQ